jgi:ribonuclease P protein component
VASAFWPAAAPRAASAYLLEEQPPAVEADVGLVTLKTRAEFQRVRGGGRWTCASFLIEGKRRPAMVSSAGGNNPSVGPRFGLTITKKIGNAVARNLIRRRFKAALMQISPVAADADTDYVVVARNAALTADFTRLIADFEIAFVGVHAAPSWRQPRSRPPKV